jgi:cytochrome c5
MMTIRLALALLGLLLLEPLSCTSSPRNSSQARSQDKPTATSATDPAKSGAEEKDPIAPTPENLAEAKKYFGYDCAMCHGAVGDGKGDLAVSMGLKMNDWRDSARIAALSDGEVFDLIVKGKGRMISEGDRYPVQIVWELVNYVRACGKKDSTAATKTGNSN